MFIPTLFLASALEATPPAVGYASMQPVRISSCALRSDPTTLTNLFAVRYSGADSVEISFTNEDVKPITSVAIDVSDGSLTRRVEDHGTFSSGVQIDHRFAAHEFALGDVTCSVQSVAYADGTSWHV